MTTSRVRAAARFAVVLGATFALGGCSIESVLNSLVNVCDGSAGAVTSIGFETSPPDSTLSLHVQQQRNVHANAYGADGFMLCPPVPTWSSSDPSIATVVAAPGQLGMVTGISTGSAFIRATIKAKTDSIRVTVAP